MRTRLVLPAVALLVTGILLGGAVLPVASQEKKPPSDPKAEPPKALLEGTKAYERMSDEQVREVEAYTLGVQAVLWGMQWVKGGEAFRLFTAPLPNGTERSPYDSNPHATNVWGHAQKLLTAEFRVIETPNTETLYSGAVIDLKGGPIVVVHPDFGERYFRTTLWELHGDTHTISQKQDGGKPAPYAIVPLGWKGDLPAGLKSIQVRSRYVFVSPHIAVYGDDDLPKVHALQKGHHLIALAEWGQSNADLPPGDPMRPIRRAESKTPPELLFFEELGETLKDITLRDDEVGFARQLAGIGLTPTDGFQLETLDAPTVAGLKRAVLDGQSIAAHQARTLIGPQTGGTWLLGFDMTSVDSWLFRAGTGFGYVWGDAASEILYPMARSDDQGKPLSGANTYALHFPKGQLPPAKYWRISMYDLNGFFISNPVNRFGIGNMAETLAPDTEGGLTIFIQNESPGTDKETNWLPAPKEGFFLIMRLYQPEERMYRGEYIIPPVTKVN
jgi:hypothetical protein